MMERSSWWILGLAVLAAAVGGYVQHRAGQPSSHAASVQTIIGQPLPSLELHTLDGQPYTLSRYKGQRLLLNFWASWCGPCRDEMPMIDHWQEGLGAQHVQVIGIAMDEPARTRAYLADQPVGYPIVVGQVGQHSTAFTLGDAQQLLPYSVLVGADGRVLATHTGAMSRSQLQAWLHL